MDGASFIILHLTGLVSLLSLSAFFSASETALFSLSKTQVERLRQEAGMRGKLVAKLLDTPRRPLVTILVGNMSVNVAFASLIAFLVTSIVGNKGAGIAVGITTVLLLIFGEITPKTVAVHNAESISKLIAYPIHLFSRLIFPLRVVLRVMTNFVIRLILGNIVPLEDRFTTEEFRAIVEVAKEEGSIQEQEKDMINIIFDLKSITAAEIMVPRTEMVCISEDSTVQQLLDLARTIMRSRIPVYKGDIDHITGIAYVRDFPLWHNYDIRNMTIEEFMGKCRSLRPRGGNTLIIQPLLVPEKRNALSLFQDFRNRRVQMAILLDEYGGTAGLVTIEDLIEEIVGGITEDHGIYSGDSFPSGDFSRTFSGRTSIRNVNRKMGLNLPADEDIDTIGGYVVHLFGRIPQQGEVLSNDNLEFEVTGADRQRVTQVMIKKVQKVENEGDAAEC